MRASFLHTCIFGKAVKPWQKFLCATVGAVGLTVGLAASGTALIVLVDRGATLCDKLLKNVKVPELDIPSLPTVKVNDQVVNRIDKVVDFGIMFVPAALGITIASTCYIAFPSLWRMTLCDFKEFANALKGVECCNIVRSTAKFCIWTPINLTCLAGCTILLPAISAWSVWLTGSILFDSFNKIQNEKKGHSEKD